MTKTLTAGPKLAQQAFEKARIEAMLATTPEERQKAKERGAKIQEVMNKK